MNIKEYIGKIKVALSENALLKRLAEAISFGIGGAIGSRALMLIAGMAVSRILNEEAYGQFSFLNTTVTTFVTLSGVGIGATLTRYVALEKDDSAKASKYIGTLRLICLAMSTIICLVLLVFVDPISIWINGDTQLSGYLRLTTIAILLSALSSIEQSILIGFENYKMSAVVQIVRCASYLIFSVLLSKAFGINGAIVALILSHGIQYVIFLVANHKEYALRGIRPEISFSNEMKGAIVHFTIPAFISSFFISPTTWFTNSLLARCAGYVDTAVFSIAYQWMTLLIFIPSQMSNVRPIYTELFAKRDFEKIKKLFLHITGASILLITPFAIIVMLASQYILGIYGDGYVHGYVTLCLMALAAIIFTVQSQIGSLIHAIGKMWLGFAANLLLSINMIGVFYLLKDQGSVGLAISYCVAYFIHCIFYYVACSYLLRKKKLN
ncbi:MAG: oligosaccharide flippase family protein [Acinetobacter sp.]